jgi:nucleoside-diphosphate-sugar epimerase
MRKVIIIGATGFIGSHLLQQLLQSGIQIFAVEHKQKLHVTPELKIIKGGIQAVTTSLINEINPDIVFHCARPTIPKIRRFGRAVSSRAAAFYNRKLIKSLKKSNHNPLLVFASGSLMYGTGEEPFDENSPLHPISFARQYQKGEKPLLDELIKKSYPLMMLRFPWLLGNGSWFKWFYLEQIRKYNAIPIFGKGLNKMHLLDIYDAVHLMQKYAFEKNEAGIYNIYGGKPILQNHFAEKVVNVFKAEQKSYLELFPNIENEGLEAFTSNIELVTIFPEILQSFKFVSLEQSLNQIKTEFFKG